MRRYELLTIVSGHKSKQTIFANSKQEAILLSKSSGAESVIDVKDLGFDFGYYIDKATTAKKIKPKELVASVVQISTMVSAGIPLVSVFEMVTKNSNGKLQEIYSNLIDEVNNGVGLGSAIEKYTKYVGSEFVSMVKLGEQTGDLASAMDELVVILEKKSQISSQIQKAMLYPTITLISTVLAFVMIITVVVPKFEVMFSKFNLSLPFFTVLLLSTERFILEYWFLLGGCLTFFTAMIFYLYSQHEQFAFELDRLTLQIPFFGKLLKLGHVSRFSMVLSKLIMSGVPIVSALEIALDSVSNRYLNHLIEQSVLKIRRGSSLIEALDQNDIYDHVGIGLIGAGEQSGMVSQMFDRVAIYYEKKFDAMISVAMVLIEPMMIVLIGTVVLVLALGIFVPLWDMSSVIKNR